MTDFWIAILEDDGKSVDSVNSPISISEEYVTLDVGIQCPITMVNLALEHE